MTAKWRKLNRINDLFPIKNSVANLVPQDFEDKELDILSPTSTLCPSEMVIPYHSSSPPSPSHFQAVPDLTPSVPVVPTPGPVCLDQLSPTPQIPIPRPQPNVSSRICIEEALTYFKMAKAPYPSPAEPTEKKLVDMAKTMDMELA